LTRSSPRFSFLAEADFPLDRSQQELFSGNFGVNVQVVAHTLNQLIGRARNR
jgi:hypothetical protein